MVGSKQISRGRRSYCCSCMLFGWKCLRKILFARGSTAGLLRKILCGLFLYSLWFLGMLARLEISNESLSPRDASVVEFNRTAHLISNHRRTHSLEAKTTTSACLMVMDDNHFLIEWIAYHYYAANLRRLIIAIDPKSLTSPLSVLQRWKDKIDITVWAKDSQYMNRLRHDEFTSVQQEIRNEFRETSPRLVEHRARQRLFYTHCLRDLKRESVDSSSSLWTMLVDVDEFVRVNYPIANRTKWWESGNDGMTRLPPPMNEPGSVALILEQMGRHTRNEGSPWEVFQSTVCLSLPRYRFLSKVTTESVELEIASSMLTQTYLHRARPKDINTNKIAKAIVDLSRVPLEDILPLNSIHMPIRKYCSNKNLHNLPTDESTLLVVNHYMGSYEQFTYRETDARNSHSNQHDILESMDSASEKETTKVNVRTAQKFKDQQRLRYTPDSDHDIVPWLDGFLKVYSKELINGVGKPYLEAKSWKPFFADSENMDDSRCALLFFGLPRSFREMVLPSLVRNVLEPNVRHGCDVYVHFYRQDTDASGRFNNGGTIHYDDIFLLKDAVQSVAQAYHRQVLQDREGLLEEDRTFRKPIVGFTHDTPEDFLRRYSDKLQKYQTTKVEIDGNEVPAYFPWKTKGYSVTTIENMVRQWHSIQSSFKLMDFTAKRNNITYTRVGIFRSDVLYVTPIDIASLGKGTTDTNTTEEFERYDIHNQYFVTPAFSAYPVNDRMIYGPHDAVKVWATQRFELLEESVQLKNNPGWQMHSERFLDTTVLPSMVNPTGDAARFAHRVNADLCFLRTRADHTVLTFDCCTESMVPSPKTSFWNQCEAKTERTDAIESLLGTTCVEYHPTPTRFYMTCGAEGG